MKRHEKRYRESGMVKSARRDLDLDKQELNSLKVSETLRKKRVVEARCETCKNID